MRKLAFSPFRVGFLGFVLLAWILLTFLSSAFAQLRVKHYDGRGANGANSIQQTRDGGRIVAGGTLKDAGDWDIWVLKLDEDGNVQWQKIYVGSRNEVANSIQQTFDGGYIVAGYTDSFGAGNADALVLKLDARGNVIWQKTYGGRGDDFAESIRQTRDGGYIVEGFTVDSNGTHFWALKLDANGNVIWRRRW